jgi:hypothetical protein
MGLFGRIRKPETELGESRVRPGRSCARKVADLFFDFLLILLGIVKLGTTETFAAPTTSSSSASPQSSTQSQVQLSRPSSWQYGIGFNLHPRLINHSQTLQGTTSEFALSSLNLMSFSATASVNFTQRFSLGLRLTFNSFDVPNITNGDFTIAQSSVSNLSTRAHIQYCSPFGDSFMCPMIGLTHDATSFLDFTTNTTMRLNQLYDFYVMGGLLFYLPISEKRGIDLNFGLNYEKGIGLLKTSGVTWASNDNFRPLFNVKFRLGPGWSMRVGVIGHFQRSSFATGIDSWVQSQNSVNGWVGVSWSIGGPKPPTPKGVIDSADLSKLKAARLERPQPRLMQLQAVYFKLGEIKPELYRDPKAGLVWRVKVEGKVDDLAQNFVINGTPLRPNADGNFTLWIGLTRAETTLRFRRINSGGEVDTEDLRILSPDWTLMAGQLKRFERAPASAPARANTPSRSVMPSSAPSHPPSRPPGAAGVQGPLGPTPGISNQR